MDHIKIAQWGGRHIAYMPLYLADRAGLFAALGLEVALYPAGNDDAIFAEITRGRAQFGIGDPAFVALGQAQGHDTRVIASIVRNACMWGLTHHDEIKPITQISDFVGLRIGTFPKPSTAYTLFSALKARHGRLLKSMQVVEAEIGNQAYLLASDQVDLIIDLEPNVSAAHRQGLRIVCAMSDFYPDMLMTGIMTSARMIMENPDLVARFTRGIQQALTLCRQQPEKAIAVGTEMFPSINANIMTEAVQRMLAINAWPEQAVISPNGWTNALRLRQEVGELAALPPFEAVVEPKFAFAALGRAGKTH